VKIGDHDLETKIRRAGQFLAAGDRVKLTVRFRGREITHSQLGRDLLDKAAAMLAAQSSIERPPLLEGKSMWLLLAPAKDKPDAAASAAAK
jgi:translation initiation factor IF-3